MLLLFCTVRFHHLPFVCVRCDCNQYSYHYNHTYYVICSYAENERVEHIYSKFLFSVIAALSAVAIFFVALTFLIGKSGLVHVIGISIFLPLFIVWYERKNLNVLFGMLMQ